MSKKQSFINEMQSLMNSVDYKWASDEAKTYWEALVSQPEVEKPMFTDNGKLILKYMQDNQSVEHGKARDSGEGLFISSRTVSGAIRKLVSDGFVEKIGQDPVVYSLTEKGKAITIED